MKNAGILPDDYVVVRPQDTAADGEIIVALVGEEATVKRFFRRTTTSACSPRTTRWSPSAPARSSVLGRVVGVFRQVA